MKTIQQLLTEIVLEKIRKMAQSYIDEILKDRLK